MSNLKNILYMEANEDGTIGGSHYCLLEIVKNLDKSKYYPIVCFYQKNSLLAEFEKYAHVLVINDHHGFVAKLRTPSLYSFCKKNIVLNTILNLYQKTYNFIRHDLYLYLLFIKLLKKYKIDLIHLNNEPTLTHWLIASKILGIRCISHIRGNLDIPWIKKRLIKYYDKVISISHSVTQEAINKNVDTTNFITIHDGIDVNAVVNMRCRSPEDIRNEFNFSTDDLIVGMVGNIKNWKGQHVLIEAINLISDKYPKIKCLLVGAVSGLSEDREYYRSLQLAVKKYNLGKQILFTGFRKDITDIISIFDVMIHTSTQPEPLGRVILEGMLLGKPVITTAHGGPLEIIDDKINGFLVKPSDPQELAERIVTVLNDINAMSEITINAKKRINEYFDINMNVNKIESLYSELLIQ